MYKKLYTIVLQMHVINDYLTRTIFHCNSLFNAFPIESIVVNSSVLS